MSNHKFIAIVDIRSCEEELITVLYRLTLELTCIFVRLTFVVILHRRTTSFSKYLSYRIIMAHYPFRLL